MKATQPPSRSFAPSGPVPVATSEHRERRSVRDFLFLSLTVILLAVVGLVLCQSQRLGLNVVGLVEVPSTFGSSTRSTTLKSKFDEAISQANEALAQSQYTVAVTKLDAAIRMVEQDPAFPGSFTSLKEKQSRLARLSRFTELSDYGQQLNFLARDTESMSVLLESLEQVGMWQSSQWWDELPAADLSPAQLDELRWDVYRTLLTLDGLLVRRMGAALGGMSDSGMAITFSMVRRYVMTDAGVNESKAAIEIGRRIDSFRPSQATRWYTATSKFRLREAQRVKASDLGPPANAADGYSLSILCLIAHMDPTFTTWFTGYGSFLSKDKSSPPSNLEALLSTVQHASEKAPSHYWTHLALGHAFYWTGDAELALGNHVSAMEKFQSARQAFTRCIEMRPTAPFAYCDRSSVARREAVVQRMLTGATTSDLEKANQLNQSSLDDARTGRQLAPNADWVHWHEGLALVESGQHDAAIQSFVKAAQFGIDFDDSADSLLVRTIDLRGRTEAIEYAKRMAETVDEPTKYLSLLSVLHYSRGDLETAKQYAGETLNRDPQDGLANIVDAWIQLQAGNSEIAKTRFSSGLLVAASNTWGMLGLARAEQETGNLQAALRLNEHVLLTGTSQRHQIAAAFASAMIHWRESNDAFALESIRQAREIDPACDLNVVVRQLVADYRSAHVKLKSASEQEREQIVAHSHTMKQLLVQLSKFPIASTKRILDSVNSGSMNTVPAAQ